MAEYEERSQDDLTEEPSPHRLEELRRKGQVAQSRELTSTVALLGIVLAIYFGSDHFIKEISKLMTELFSKDLPKLKDLTLSYPMGREDWMIFSTILSQSFRVCLMVFFPIALTAALFGFLTSVAQVGFVFTTETLNPDFERINPISGFMRLFSLKSLTEGVKSLLKFIVITSALYISIKGEVSFVPETIGLKPAQLLTYVGGTTIRLLSVVLVFLFATSAFDYFIQWRRFRSQARMTKAEAKQELKEREGDPQIKARIRSIQRETARKRMMKSVPKADVIITNPTHIAVAIRYRGEEGFAPRVVAKGGDFLAERIKKIARENGIPTVENKPLARTLYKHVKVGQMIPRSLYQAVAEVLAYVYRIRGYRPNINAESNREM